MSRTSRDALEASFVGGAILAAFVLAMVRASGAAFSILAAAGLVGGAAVIVMSGVLIVHWSAGDTDVPQLTLAIVVGSVAASLFLVGGCFLTGLRAGTVFAGWTVLVAGVAWRTLRPDVCFKLDRADVVPVIVIAVTVALWCRHSAALLPTMRATGIAPIWIDYFVHGAQIDQFGARLATGRSSFVVSGQAVDVYHYGSYMLPAAVSGVVDLPGVALAASVLFPCGVLLLLLGTYALVRTLATSAIGLLTAQALLIVPDAPTYGLRNGFFGLHWFLGASPGTGYAIGTAFTALTFMAIWRRTRRRECLWIAGCLTVAIVQIRVQLFLLFAPALVATLISESDAVRRHARRIAAVSIAAIVAMLAAVLVVAAARPAALQLSSLRAFLEIVHTGQAPSAYDGAYQWMSRRYGLEVAELVGFLALIPAVLGALTLLGPVAGAIAVCRSGAKSLDTFPLWCLLGWLGLAIVVPTDLSEALSYQYHSFVLVYAAGFVWTIVMAHRALAGTRFEQSFLRAVVLGFAGVALFVSWLGSTKDSVEPRAAWTRPFYATPMDRGLLDAAAFVRARAEPGDIFVLVPAQPSAYFDDAAIRFAALADVPAYLTRPGIQGSKPRLRAVVEQRVAQSQTLASTTDSAAAFDLLRQAGVTFLVTLGPQIPRFDPAHADAVFRSHDTAVYRIARP